MKDCILNNSSKHPVASYNVFRNTGNYLIQSPLDQTVKLPPLFHKKLHNQKKNTHNTSYIYSYNYLKTMYHY
jgi:hypothetical protein